jgi:hypothetical protein
MSREWMKKLAPEVRARLEEHFARRPNGRSRKTAEELRARKSETQCRRREGKRIARDHEADALNIMQ